LPQNIAKTTKGLIEYLFGTYFSNRNDVVVAYINPQRFPGTAMLNDDLLTYLFDGQSNLLVQSMTTWLESSRRFAAFVNTFKDKIRKKLRTTQDQGGLLDLQLELETAYLLLQERTLSLAYEPEQSKRMRSPDFAVTFTSSLTFMVEVTRVQVDQKPQAGEASEHGPASSIGVHLVDAVASKLGQLLPQRSNILLIGVKEIPLTADELHAEIRSIQRHAERHDSTLLHMHGFRDRADFFRYYQRLSEVIVRWPHLGITRPIVSWINPQAKLPLPGNVRTVLYRSLTK
jgi:hypothetical protein